jgi:hypothetical protein
MSSNARCAIALVVFAAVLLLAAPASAAPYPPPSDCATFEVSTTTPAAGATVQVSGRNWQANAAVRVWINPRPRPLGTLRANGSGTFSGGVEIPSDRQGRNYLSARGKARCGEPAPVAIDVQAPEAQATGGLPLTGGDVAMLALLGLALSAAGALVLTAVRSRRARV